tara:strand:- start:1804 stop:2802 length:999 start_codon:yes stop_codon:yes gene_type:complete
MAVSIDTVYQRVLSVANKEQRGYVTPQEFNLFANQAQMDIFEQYFYDLNQFSRLKGNNNEYADMVTILEEKINIFKKLNQPVTIINQFGDGTLPSNIYRLGTLSRLALTNVEGSVQAIIELVTEDDIIRFNRSLLAKPTIKRPIYTRTSSTGVKIRPSSTDPSKSAAPYFVVGGFATTGGSSNIVLDLTNPNSTNYTFIEVGQGVDQANIPGNTFVGSITTGTSSITIGLVNSSGNAVNATGNGSPVQVTFASDDVKCNYVQKPTSVSWNYTEINGVAMYNSANSVDFELHASEETELVFKILQLAGIAIESMDLYQVAAQEEVRNIQQEKI